MLQPAIRNFGQLGKVRAPASAVTSTQCSWCRLIQIRFLHQYGRLNTVNGSQSLAEGHFARSTRMLPILVGSHENRFDNSQPTSPLQKERGRRKCVFDSSEIGGCCFSAS